MQLSSKCFKSRDVILTTSLRHSNVFEMPISRQWHDEGITVEADILNGIHNVSSLEEMYEQCDINIISLEYRILKTKVNSFLELQEKPKFIEQK